MPEPDPDFLLKQAFKCRNLARSTLDERTRQTLLGMAQEYEGRAGAIVARTEKD
jgi:hypothetical protein